MSIETMKNFFLAGRQNNTQTKSKGNRNEELKRGCIKRQRETKPNFSTEKYKMKGMLTLNYDSIETCIIHPELVETANHQASKRNLKFRPICPLLWSNVQGLWKCGEGFWYAVMEEVKIEKKKRKKKVHIVCGLFHRLLNLFPVMFWKGQSYIQLDIFKNKMGTTGLVQFYSVFICCFDVAFMHFLHSCINMA